MPHFDVFNGDADGLCALHQLRLAEPADAVARHRPEARHRAARARRRRGRRPGHGARRLARPQSRRARAAARARRAGALVRPPPRGRDPGAPAPRGAHRHGAGDLHERDRRPAPRRALPRVGGRRRVRRQPRAHRRRARRLDRPRAPASSRRCARSARISTTTPTATPRRTCSSRPPSSTARSRRTPTRCGSPRRRRCVAKLRAGRLADMGARSRWRPIGRASTCYPTPTGRDGSSGTLANDLAARAPDRAHAVLVPCPNDGYRVSIRAPRAAPNGCAALAREFATGGGREAAAGIDHLPVAERSSDSSSDSGRRFRGAERHAAPPVDGAPPRLAGLARDHHRRRDRSAEQPVGRAERHRAERALQRRQVDDRRLQREPAATASQSQPLRNRPRSALSSSERAQNTS